MIGLIVCVALGYLAGSLASAILVCRALKLSDPREGGSGNPGATNVMRLHGRGPAALTLAGDVLKGLLPVVIAGLITNRFGVVLTGIAAFLGHLYPLYFGFKGGKGVATFIGVLWGWGWLLGAWFCLAWLATARIAGYSSLAALVATCSVPLVALVSGRPAAMVLGTIILGGLLLYRHRGNIARLRAGTEDRMRWGRRSTAETTGETPGETGDQAEAE